MTITVLDAQASAMVAEVEQSGVVESASSDGHFTTLVVAV